MNSNNLVSEHRGLMVIHVITRVDRMTPYFLEHIAVPARLQDDLEGTALCRKTYRLVERAIDLSCFAGRFPFAVDAAEASRPGDHT